jgi:NAD(P)-dependent dehydrogenase (short-subunit alcohol dehydrogenase family)
MSSKSLAMGPPKAGPGRLFIRAQFCTKPQHAPPGTDLTGRVAIVTGASAGLGFHVCRHLLSLNLTRLIMAVRTPSKGESAAAKLRAEHPSARVDVWALEMTSYDSIRSFVRRVESDLPRLDIAILNAGVVAAKFGLVPSTGHETTIQVNYISTALLSILLLPTLKSKSPPGSPGRLTIVGSGVAYWSKLPNRDKVPFLSSFDDEKITPWDTLERYPASKLLLHMFLVKLAGHVAAQDVVVNVVDPGYCKGSELHREADGLMDWILSGSKAITGRKPEDGAWTYVDAAVVKGPDSHGCFLSDWQIVGYVFCLFGCGDFCEITANSTVDLHSIFTSLRHSPLSIGCGTRRWPSLSLRGLEIYWG